MDGLGPLASDFKAKLKALEQNASDEVEMEGTGKGSGKSPSPALLRTASPYSSKIASALYLPSDLTEILLTMKREGAWEESLAMLWWVVEEKREMLQRWHVNIVISTLADAQPPQWEMACVVLDSMESLGLGRDAYSYASAITACSRAGQTQNAVKIFQQCCTETDPRKGPNEVVFNATLQACVQAGPVWHSQVLAVFASMVAYGVQPSAWQYSVILNAYAQTNQWQKVLDMHREMKSRRSGPQPESHCYGAAMRACLRAGQFSQVIQLYNEMLAEKEPLTAYTLVPVFGACSQMARITNRMDIWRQAKSIMEQAEPTGVLNMNCYAALMQVYADCGVYEEAFALLMRMTRATPRIEPNVHVFTPAIASLGMSRNWRVAISLLRSIHKRGVEVNGATMEATIKVLGSAGQWYEACELLCTMSARYNVQPNHIHLTNVLECLSIDEKWHEAYAVLDAVFYDLLDDCVIDTRVLEIIIRVCSRAGAWKRAFDFLTVAGDEANMNMCHDVVTVLLEEGQWDLAKELFDDMRERRFVGQSMLGLRSLASIVQEAALRRLNKGVSVGEAALQRLNEGEF